MFTLKPYNTFLLSARALFHTCQNINITGVYYCITPRLSHKAYSCDEKPFSLNPFSCKISSCTTFLPHVNDAKSSTVNIFKMIFPCERLSVVCPMLHIPTHTFTHTMELHGAAATVCLSCGDLPLALANSLFSTRSKL